MIIVYVKVNDIFKFKFMYYMVNIGLISNVIEFSNIFICYVKVN